MALWHDWDVETEDGLSDWAQWLKGHEVTVCNVVTLADSYRAKFSSRQPVAVAVKLAIKYIREHFGGEVIEVETLFYNDKGEFKITFS